ncbi:MAG: pitrilysin family protein [Candidatus Sulfopaludibacter sp.]|nr:pitrilysin family protein [Candidatus Sulfopaludibacter sp.]
MKAPPLCLLLLLAPVSVPAQDLKAFEKKVTEFTLPNGLHFIVAERHEAPVISFETYVNAGSVDDPSGRTGIAHMFEHMAFKGTETIGTRDWAAEKKALDSVEEINDSIEAESDKGLKADSSKIDLLKLRLKVAMESAESYVVPNEFLSVIEENGGADLNAGTSLDSTVYHYSLPSGRMELWFLLESQRFLHPVFREFYTERDVVMEEERMRIESNAQGKLIQQFLAASFEAHPYRNPGTGWPSDLKNLRTRDAEAFFEKYYVPANMTIAIVGDVDPAEARRMAERYFGPLPARPLPSPVRSVEPPQAGDKSVTVDLPSQPLAVIGYHRPDQNNPDDPVFDVLQLILSNGRTGLLYKHLVQDQKLAVNALAYGTFPEGRYPNEFVFILAPALNHTVEENQRALDALMLRFASKPVDMETLDRAKTKARSIVIRRLADNAGLANLLATYYVNYGDWRKLFTSVDDINKVSASDVQRVALKYLIARPRTVAYIRTRVPSPAPAGAGFAGGR